MKGEKLELVRGSGNVFRDLGRENADVEQLKSFSKRRKSAVCWIAMSLRSALRTQELDSQPPISHASATRISTGLRPIDWYRFSTAWVRESK